MSPRALVTAVLLLAVTAASPPVDAQQALKIAKIARADDAAVAATARGPGDPVDRGNLELMATLTA